MPMHLSTCTHTHTTDYHHIHDQSTVQVAIHTPQYYLYTKLSQYIPSVDITCLLILLSRCNWTSQSAKSVKVWSPILDQHVRWNLFSYVQRLQSTKVLLMSSSCNNDLVTLVTKHELSNHDPLNLNVSVTWCRLYLTPVSRDLPYTQWLQWLLNQKYKEHSVVNTGIMCMHMLK